MIKIESYKRGIILSTVFNIFNKGLVFLNGIVVAYFFNATERTDIYFYIYNSLIIISGFFMSLNSSVLIPESMRITIENGRARSIGFLNFFFYLYASIVLLGILLVMIDPVAVFSFASNFNQPLLAENANLLYLSLPLFGLACLITLMVDILTSNKFFTISMTVGILNGLLSIFIIVALHNRVGISSAFYGLLASYLVNFILLLLLMKRKLKWRFNIVTPNIPWRIWKNIGFAQSGNLMSMLALYTPIYILSGFDKGIITALTFAQQIAALPNALITTQFSSVAGIKLNELFAVVNQEGINKVFTEAANFLHFTMIPLSLLMFFYSTEIVNVILAFSSLEASTGASVALFIKYLGLLLPFYVSNTLISRLFMASHKIKEAFWYQFVFNAIQIISVYSFIKKFGPIAYPITLIFIYVSSTLFYYFVEKKYFNLISYNKILKNLFLFALINICISISVYFLIKSTTIINSFQVLLLAFSLNVIILLLINRYLKMNELISDNINSITIILKNKIFKKYN